MESQSIKWIYELVSLYLKKIFKCKIYNQFMSFDKEDEIGIFLYDGQNDQYTIDGNVTFRDIKVQVQYNCKRSNDGLYEGLDKLTEFVDLIEHTQSVIPNISFVSVEHQGAKAKILHRNEYDIQVAYCTLDIKYTFNNE